MEKYYFYELSVFLLNRTFWTPEFDFNIRYEKRHEKTCILYMLKQRCRSAAR